MSVYSKMILDTVYHSLIKNILDKINNLEERKKEYKKLGITELK